MAWNIHKEATYDHPPERVWRALTEQDALARWLMANDFKLAVGHKFNFRAKPVPGWKGVTYCEVLEIVPERRLVLSWRGDEGSPVTKVAWTLEPVDGGKRTRLTLAHTGLAGLRGLMMKMAMDAGWGRKMSATIPTTDKWGSSIGAMLEHYAGRAKLPPLAEH